MRDGALAKKALRLRLVGDKNALTVALMSLVASVDSSMHTNAYVTLLINACLLPLPQGQPQVHPSKHGSMIVPPSVHLDLDLDADL